MTGLLVIVMPACWSSQRRVWKNKKDCREGWEWGRGGGSREIAEADRFSKVHL